jgi:hypothetical protein
MGEPCKDLWTQVQSKIREARSNPTPNNKQDALDALQVYNTCINNQVGPMALRRTVAESILQELRAQGGKRKVHRHKRKGTHKRRHSRKGTRKHHRRN